ncbi:MAG: DUF1858 domain-containing protein [Christensenellales bacterium]
MADKVLNFNKTVYELCTADPGIIPILEEAGFSEVTKPGMLSTVGRFMTIPKGAALRKVDMETIKRIFEKHGYTIKEDST